MPPDKRPANRFVNGANPVSVLNDLLKLTHNLTQTLLLPAFVNDPSLSESEKIFLKETSAKISVAALSKIWQMLIKGLNEMQTAPVPIDALEMVLIRIAYSANLPSPAEVMESIKKKSESGIALSAAPTAETLPLKTAGVVVLPAKEAVSGVSFADINELLKYLEEKKQPRFVYMLKHDMEICNFANGKITFKADDRLTSETLAELNRTLEDLTGQKWSFDIAVGKVEHTIAEKEKEQKENDKKNVAQTPLVKAILDEFRGAKIETITRKIPAQGEAENDDNEVFDNNQDEDFNNED